MDAVVAPPRNLWKIVGIGLTIPVLLLIVAGALIAYASRHNDLPIPVSTGRTMINVFATIAVSTISAALLLGAMFALKPRAVPTIGSRCARGSSWCSPPVL